MNNQSFSKIWIVVIVIVLLAGGIFAWQYFRVPKEEVKDETVNWFTFVWESKEETSPEMREALKIEGCDFAVKFPKHWGVFRWPAMTWEQPEGYFIAPIKPNIEPIEAMDAGDPEYCDFGISLHAEKMEDSINKKINSGMQKSYEIISGSPTLKISESTGWISYYIKKGDKNCLQIYYFEKKDKCNNIYNQMLSTFRFIELEETVEETECEKWRKECAEEGENLCGPCGCKSCCPGLVKRDVTYPYRNKNNEVFCLEEMTAYTCVKCGDKICGKGEDWCICPEDCPKPNPEDLQIFIMPE